MLKLPQKIIGNPIDTLLWMLITKAFDARYKTGPGTIFKLIKHWGFMLLFISHTCHIPLYFRFRITVRTSHNNLTTNNGSALQLNKLLSLVLEKALLKHWS